MGEFPAKSASSRWRRPAPKSQIFRKHGISATTFYKWRSKFGGVAVSDVKTTALGVENRRLEKNFGKHGAAERRAENHCRGML